MGGRNAVRQKRRERFLLERFIEASGIEAQIVEQREAPDFVVQVEDRLVGIEVTGLFVSPGSHGGTLQAQEAISSRIVVKAQQLYQVIGAPPAHVIVCFVPDCDLRDLNRDNASRQLCDWVHALNLSPWQRVDWRPDESHGLLPDEISFIHALGVPTFSMAHWSVARAGWVAPLTTAPLQARIDAKAELLQRYCAVTAETWLLIVADSMNPSSLIEIRSDFDGRAVASPFGKTFFYQHPHTVLDLGMER
jgi:hypothetical protein